MAHKLAKRWSCFLLYDSGLTPKGTMDLRTMDSDGNLAEGWHEIPGATPPRVRISGMARGLGPLYILTLQNEYNDTYEGMLSQETKGGKLVVAGKKIYGSERSRAAETKEQEDPPWIITKP